MYAIFNLMKYQLLKDLLPLIERFDKENRRGKEFKGDITGFKAWIAQQYAPPIHATVNTESENVPYEGLDNGRSPESVINTLIVHMNRYAKAYSKSAMVGTDFSSQDDFIFLINLKAFGALTKMELIRKNKQDKPSGMQIINRLIKQGWVGQRESNLDKRSKVIEITPLGLETLDKSMVKIRQATEIVAGNLTDTEKLQLIRLLHKLDMFHQEIYDQNLDSEHLLDHVMHTKLTH